MAGNEALTLGNQGSLRAGQPPSGAKETPQALLLGPGGRREAPGVRPPSPAPRLRLRVLDWRSRRGGVAGTRGRPDPRPEVRVLPVHTAAPSVKAADQRPRPGHEGRDHSVSDQGLKGGRPGLWVAPPAGALRDLKPQGPVKPPVPLRALAEGPQHCLLGARVWAPLEGWAPRRAGAAPLHPRRPGAPPALRGRDLDGHGAPDPFRVAGTPEPPLHVTVPGAGEIRPQDGLRGRLGGKAPPGLGDHPPRVGGIPVQRHPGERSGADAAPSVLRLEGPAPGLRLRLGEGWRRRPGRAQVAAHGSRRRGGGSASRSSRSRRTQLPAKPLGLR